MTDRLQRIFALIPYCDTFADIGCDHGYMAQAMLCGNKCEKVIIADVSEKCLKKAQDLLSPFVEAGKVYSAVADGFDNLPHSRNNN